MQTYMIVDRGDGAGYNVELTDAIGVRHTMLGFETEAEAQVWIEHDQRGRPALLKYLQSRASYSGSSAPYLLRSNQSHAVCRPNAVYRRSSFAITLAEMFKLIGDQRGGFLREHELPKTLTHSAGVMLRAGRWPAGRR